MNKKILIILIATLLIGNCLVCSKNFKFDKSPDHKYYYRTSHKIGHVQRGVVNVKLPLELVRSFNKTTFKDSNWGMIGIVCEEGGYNLTKYAGKEVLN